MHSNYGLESHVIVDFIRFYKTLGKLINTKKYTVLLTVNP